MKQPSYGRREESSRDPNSKYDGKVVYGIVISVSGVDTGACIWFRSDIIEGLFCNIGLLAQ